MNLAHNCRGINVSAIGVFALTVLCVCLTIPLPAHSQSPVAQNSPVVTMPLSGWYYRWGNSPLDEEGMPLWTRQNEPTPEWKLVGDASGAKAERQGQSDLWLMIQPPEGQWQNPGLLVPPVIHSLNVYQGQRHVYRSEEFKTPDSIKYSSFKWHQISLERELQSDMIFLKIYSDSPQFIGMSDYPLLLIGHQTDLTRELIT